MNCGIANLPPSKEQAPTSLPPLTRKARIMDDIYLYEETPIDELDIEAGDFSVSFLFAEQNDGNWAVTDTYIFNAPDDIEAMSAMSQQIKQSYGDKARYADYLDSMLKPSEFEDRMFEVPPVEEVTGSRFLASYIFTREMNSWSPGGAYLFNVADTGNALQIISSEIGNIDWNRSQSHN